MVIKDSGRRGNFEGEAIGRHAVDTQPHVQYSIKPPVAVHAILEVTNVHDVVRMAKDWAIRSNVPPYRFGSRSHGGE